VSICIHRAVKNSFMEPFDYQPRTRVVFGAGSLERLGEIVQSLGGRRVLVVSDPGIVGAGYAGRAAKLLQAAGVEAFIFDGIEENPTTRHVNEGVRFAAPHSIDLIVGLGGGSSMDCAKGINFLLTNGGRMADYWGSGKASKPMLPFIAIPTTAGTGSEAQSFALIADEHTHQKMACGDRKVMPAAAILDPELTLTQPAMVTADTGVDAISHALETWVTKRRNPVSTLFSQAAWRLLSANFGRVLENPSDLEARAAMQLGAFYAGSAIENSMLGAAHSCANPLTAHYNVVHGAAVGVMLPAVIRYNGPAVGTLYGDLAGSRDGAETLASRVESLLQQAALPTRLSDYKIPEDILPKLALEASRQWTAQFNPRPVTENDLLEIYRCAY
jgi:alcohol dehydrogenase